MSNRKRTLIFLNLIITSFSASLLATAMVIALPHITNDLNISLGIGQWVTSGFALASAIIMPLSAYLIHGISTKRLYMGCLIFVIIGLIICTIAQTFPVLMAGRIIQAASGGILGAMAQVLLLTVYPRDKHGSVMGWYGMAIGFAPVIAPTISGILMDLFTWRSVFVLCAVLMAISWICALFVFDNFLPTRLETFDVFSFTLSAVAFGGLTLGAGNITNYGLMDPYSYVPLLIGIMTIIWFTKRQMSLAVPLLDFKLFSNRTFALASISAAVHNFVMQGSGILTPTLVQTIYGCSATETGLFMLLPCIVFATTSPIAGKVYDKFGIRKLYMVSSLTLFATLSSLAFATEEMPLLVVLIIYAIRNAALAMLMMPLITWGMSTLEKDQIAQGTAVMRTLNNVAGAIGSAVIIGFMAFVTNISDFSPHAVMYGFNGAFGFSGVCTIIMVIIAFFFIKPKKVK